eukprot:s1818_g7.t1
MPHTGTALTTSLTYSLSFPVSKRSGRHVTSRELRFCLFMPATVGLCFALAGLFENTRGDSLKTSEPLPLLTMRGCSLLPL